MRIRSQPQPRWSRTQLRQRHESRSAGCEEWKERVSSQRNGVNRTGKVNLQPMVSKFALEELKIIIHPRTCGDLLGEGVCV